MSATSICDDTVKETSTDFTTDPALPLTRRGKVPAGVALVVESVSVLVQVSGSGAQLAGLNEADTPSGSGSAGSRENATALPAPEFLVTVIMLEPDEPCTAEMLLLLLKA